MTRPRHLDHTMMFAPIFIGMFFGLAIVGSMSIFVPSKLPVTNAMSQQLLQNTGILTYEDCINSTGSTFLEKYPPACMSVDGNVYEQPMPDILYPEM